MPTPTPKALNLLPLSYLSLHRLQLHAHQPAAHQGHQTPRHRGNACQIISPPSSKRLSILESPRPHQVNDIERLW